MGEVVAAGFALVAGGCVAVTLYRACLRGAPAEPLPGEQYLPLRGRWLRMLLAGPGILLISGFVAVLALAAVNGLAGLLRW